MNNLNTVLIEGQLTRDPELGNAPAQVQMCRLTLANNRYYKGKEDKWVQDASYFTVYVYGNVATSCLTYLKKGRGVRIVGRLKQLTRQVNGMYSEKIIILAEHIEFQPAKKAEAMEEPEHIPGEINTKSSNIEELMETAKAAEEPIPDIIPDDVPQCELEDEESPETKAEADEGEIFEDDQGEAVGF
jgi:single-strand DNA-binding protein